MWCNLDGLFAALRTAGNDFKRASRLTAGAAEVENIFV